MRLGIDGVQSRKLEADAYRQRRGAITRKRYIIVTGAVTEAEPGSIETNHWQYQNRRLYAEPIRRMRNVPNAPLHLRIFSPVTELERMPSRNDNRKRNATAVAKHLAHIGDAVELPPKRPVTTDQIILSRWNASEQLAHDDVACNPVLLSRHGSATIEQTSALVFAPL
jgi:hypothetical protein